ncbi:chemotaxis protein CheY [Paenibacillus jamilae]|uniref:Chemotaxis protein CheY n=1 Tax=Paenibacillus jamilae TaxID=114136 RepID=A0ACC4ZPL5_9BACL|nr:MULTISPECIES: response regulator [Paenibacillus]MCV9952357.1 response regulator [Paenibacillus sp. BT-177]AUO08846.1 DNA-binding response regulator [Paenibacillus sp. lzh-N1]AZH29464.1 response regulator [Paenibacillus sp. M-152]KTS78805.1 chemotaxis protein CheY [Paenibacillus jamilae]OAZ50499.1 DNA-binding response regulator [Paenibacillus polymyxa]
MYKVMIVDDEPLFRDFLRIKIDWESHGFRVCCEARNGREALQEAERHQPHLALVDINMPFIDGIELAQRLKVKFERIVIVFISGHNEFEYLQKAVRTGVQDYLLKPFNAEEMLSMLERIKPKLPVLPQESESAELRGQGGEALHSRAGMPDLGHLRDAVVLDLRMKDSETLEEVRKAIRQLSKYNWGDEYADAMLMGIVSLALSFASERGIPYDQLWENGGDNSPYERLRELDSWEAAEGWMLTLYRKLIQLMENMRPTKASNLFAAAINYIEEHYADSELSAEQVSCGVFVDPSYLRRVFRKESGFSIVDHITHIRMKKAKELLLKGNRKLSEIAESVGYSDPNYFSKCFKKRFGMTPTEYEQLKKR